MSEKPQGDRQTTESTASVEMNKKIPGTDNPPAAQMTAPAADNTKMVAAPAKLVKIKALRDINIGTALEPKILQPDQEAEVTPAQAVEFCDKGFKGLYPYSGERYEDKQCSVIHRAVRV